MPIAAEIPFDQVVRTFTELAPRLKVLSLDCFDTLLWRGLETPTDVFYHLGDLPARQRAKAESQARQEKLLLLGQTEVTLEEIYTRLFRDENTNHGVYIERELAAEARFGILFEPACELLHQAREKGLRTIVVSDTYLSSAQLRALLNRLDPTVEGLIDKIYCSSELGKSKAGGLWPLILRREKVPPAALFHVGDNPAADYEAPKELGIQAVAYSQYFADDISRFEARQLAHGLASARNDTPNLFRDWYATDRAYIAQAPSHTAIGARAVGPIMAGFCAHIEACRKSLGRDNTKVAFLMRDGYLPGLCYDSLTGECSAQLYLSRFTSQAGALRNRQDVVDFLGSAIYERDAKMILRQLLVEDRFLPKLTKLTKGLTDEACRKTIAQFVLSREVLTLVLDRAREFRARLMRHIQTETGIEAGQTLLLVDLGYTGTTMRLMRGLIEKALDIKVRACYLIASGDRHQNGVANGLIHPGMLEDVNRGAETVNGLVRFISPLEMLCKAYTGSAIGYHEDGTVRQDACPEADTDSHILPMRQGVLHFIEANRDRILTLAERPMNDPILARQVLTDVARLLYFPTQAETRLLEQMSFDMNLGTDITMALADTERSLMTMREQGVFYGLLDQSSKQHTAYAADVRYAGQEYAVALLALYANGLGYNPSPLTTSQRRVNVPVIFILGKEEFVKELEAVQTFDGYYLLSIPAGVANAGVLLGRHAPLVEIDRVVLTDPLRYKNLKSGVDSLPMEPGKDYELRQTESLSPHLHRFSEQGHLFLPYQHEHKRYTIQVVFRWIS